MKKLIAAGAAGAAAALAGMVAARTLAFKPRAEERPAPDAAGVDEKKVVASAAEDRGAITLRSLCVLLASSLPWLHYRMRGKLFGGTLGPG